VSDATSPGRPRRESEEALKELKSQLSSLQALLVLSMRMTESGEEDQLLQLAATSVPSFCHCRLDGVYLSNGQSHWLATAGPCQEAEVRVDLEAQFAVMNEAGGALAIIEEPWAWAFPLRSLDGHFGYLVVGGDEQPLAPAMYLLRVLSQQTGIALANARLHARERSVTADLRSANGALADTVAALELSTAIHVRLTGVAGGGEGQEGIAIAVHELTGYPVAVEDRYGNLRAWAGPGRPDPYPKDDPTARTDLLALVAQAGKPVRDAGRLIALAHPKEDVLGVLVLIDPDATAGEAAEVALEHAATVLSMELARLSSLSETDLRLRSDLVEQLLSGADDEAVHARAQVLGYDLDRPHRVVVVEARGRVRDDESFFHAVRRAAHDVGAGSLVMARGRSVVLLADTERPWPALRNAIIDETGGGTCRLGVGGVCDGPADFPRSFHQARLALKMQDTSAGGDRATSFDELGVYRILAEVDDAAGIEQFVLDWLGALLDYDAQHRSELVATLSQYLQFGGNYDATARALSVHRSTLKYRLQRIREISGHELSDPDIGFNLQLATRAWQTLTALRAQ
jgi:DNA-binding PucR family transcriptional regulator